MSNNLLFDPPPATQDHGLPLTNPDLQALVAWQEEMRWRVIASVICADYATDGWAELAEVSAPDQQGAGWHLWRSADGGLWLADLRADATHRGETIEELLGMIEAALEADAEPFVGREPDGAPVKLAA